MEAGKVLLDSGYPYHRHTVRRNNSIVGKGVSPWPRVTVAFNP